MPETTLIDQESDRSTSESPAAERSSRRVRSGKLAQRLRVAGMSTLGLMGLSGVVLAVGQYFRQSVPRGGQEQRLYTQINAPYGSVSIRSGTPPNTVAVVESDEENTDGLHIRYATRNQTIGLLRIGIGTDEGMLQQQQLVSTWRTSNPGFSLARSGQVTESDLGGASGIRGTLRGSLPGSLPPLPHNVGYFRIVTTDAGTLVIPEPMPATAATRVFLSKDIPMSFRADLGFGESSVDLTGIPVTDAYIETGASKANIVAREPNPQPMGSYQVSAGLGECSVSGISYLNPSRFEFSGGVGTYHLGFEGRLTRNLDAYISVGLGKCTVTIPPTAARVQVIYDDNLLSSYNFSGLSKRRDGYATSVGFENANTPVLTLHLSSGMGKMTVTYR